jgi:DNA end-binding protein Ku
MLFGDEVLSPDRLDELDGLSEAEASQRELRMAQQLIDSLSSDFDPSKFKDEYRERVLELIERKAAGEEIAVEPEAEETAPAPDLMAALEASLAEVRSGSSDTPATAPSKPAAKPRKRSTSAKSSGAKDGGRSRTKASKS